MTSDDGDTWVDVSGRPAVLFQSRSVFPDLETASSFFERGALGYSDTDDAGRYEALELVLRTGGSYLSKST